MLSCSSELCFVVAGYMTAEGDESDISNYYSAIEDEGTAPAFTANLKPITCTGKLPDTSITCTGKLPDTSITCTGKLPDTYMPVQVSYLKSFTCTGKLPDTSVTCTGKLPVEVSYLTHLSPVQVSFLTHLSPVQVSYLTHICLYR